MRREAPLVTLVIVTAFLAGCTAPAGVVPPADDAAAPARVAPAEWKAALSEPAFDGVERSIVTIPSADGTQLSLTLHLPAGLPGDSRIPTLLEITPYQGGRMWTPATGTGSSGSWWEFVVERGAAYVRADARGTNGSEGCLDFGGTKDREDARAFVEWVRAQPWSNGRVVTDGISHPGMGSVVAHAAVPDLTAALTHAPVVSYYQDEWLQGAKFEDQMNGVGYQYTEAWPSLYGDEAALKAQAADCTGGTAVDFNRPDGRFDDVWADRDLSRHASQARAPILVTHGFVDQNVHPDHFQLYWDALPDDFPKHAILGWWYHNWPDMDGHAADSDGNRHPFFDLRHRWLDATLFNASNGLWAEPRVLVEDSVGTWHESRDWPVDGSQTVTWHATADGALAGEAADAGGRSYADAPGAKRGSWTDAHVAFRSEPFGKAMLVNGAPTVRLAASSTAEATKWVAYLVDEAPDGSWERVTHGYADSRTWNGEDKWEPMEPGKAYAWELRLMPTAVVVEEGHRLVLVVASQDSRGPPFGMTGAVASACWDDRRGGCYRPSGIVPAESAGSAVNTVLAGPDGTTVTFAWVDPAATAKPPW